MAQTILRVSTDEITRTVNAFNGNLSQVTTLTNQMTALIQGLQPICNGEPFDTFRNRAMQLSGDMDQIKKMITGHIDELTQVAGIMNNLASDNSNIVNGLPTDVIS
jgi:uncharacterized protein YukE